MYKIFPNSKIFCRVPFLNAPFFKFKLYNRATFGLKIIDFLKKKAHLSSGSYLNNSKFKAFESIRQGLFKTNFKTFLRYFKVILSFFKNGRYFKKKSSLFELFFARCKLFQIFMIFSSKLIFSMNLKSS